jgi:diaminopimelate decarboxylase
MDHFTFIPGPRGSTLHAEGVSVEEIARRVGTPVYVYSTATLKRHATILREAFAALEPLVCFAVKSCPNVHVLRLLHTLGLGMDVVSAGELTRARAAGAPGAMTVFAGVGKTDEEIGLALAGAGGGPVRQFNVESEQELHAIARVAAGLGVVARVALRVNPLVTAGGHAHVQTATESSKFGVAASEALAMGRSLAGPSNGLGRSVRLRGVHIHLGSSINSPEPYERAIVSMLGLIDELVAMGHTIDTFDMGGGFGADYETGVAPRPEVFARAIVPLLEGRARAGLRVVIEPGRFIAANAGVLLTRVLYVKPAAHGARRFVVVDAGMNTLARPALYGSFHFAWPANVPAAVVPLSRGRVPSLAGGATEGLGEVDIVGPVCESTDVLAAGRLLPEVSPGDLLAVFTAGAYGMSMASRYNSHPLPAEVLVDGAASRVVRRRETLNDLIAHELSPGEL